MRERTVRRPSGRPKSSVTDSSPTRPAITARRWRTGPRGGSPRRMVGSACSASPSGARYVGAARLFTTTSAPSSTTTAGHGTSSPPTHRTNCGGPTSPSTRPSKASRSSARSRMHSVVNRRVLDRPSDEVPIGRPSARDRRRGARRRRRLHRPQR